MVRRWPFFGTMLDDVEMVMAKSDLDIAAAFSRLAGSLHGKFFPQIEAEFARAEAWILRLKGTDRMLAEAPRLALPIRLRNPYIDSMSLMHVDLVSRRRMAGRDDETLFAALVATVNEIAQGMQNTG